MEPEEMEQKSSLFAFKREIKQWSPNNCRVGYVKTTYVI